MRVSTLALVAVAALGVTAPDAAGQDDTGPRITATVGGAIGVGLAAGSVSVGAGYRFSRLLAIDAEVGYVPSLDREDLMGGPGRSGMGPMFGPDPIPGYRFHFDADLVTVMSTVSVEAPVAGPHVRVFGLGGAGVSRFHEGFGVSFGATGIPSYDVRETAPLVAVGGGLEVDAWKGLALGGEVRYFHVFGDRRPLDVTRVAARLGWRF